MAEPALPPARYEPSDVTFRFLACGAGVVIGTILLCAFGVMWIYPNAVQDRRIPSALPVYPAPRLQSDPATDLRRFTAKELSRLNSIGWVDKSHGIVHIPIDQAMQKIAAQGIPDWPTPQGSKP
jgi:hypothetical protein